MAKTTIYIGLTVGGVVGGYAPVLLWGAGVFSLASIVGGFIGCVAGAWLGWKLTEWIEG